MGLPAVPWDRRQTYEAGGLGMLETPEGSVNLSDQGRERPSSPRDLMLPRRPLATCSSPQRGRLGRWFVLLGVVDGRVGGKKPLR
jgi:hypothetical protein